MANTGVPVLSMLARFIVFESTAAKFPTATFGLVVIVSFILLHLFVLEPLLYGPHSHIPGPKPASLSWYYLSYFDLCFCRNEKTSEWHKQYGPVVRIRPNEVTLGDPRDYREIYDTKSKYDKTTYFKRFTLYGEDNLFSTVTYHNHQAKKRKIAAPYAKSNIVANAESLVRERVRAFEAAVSAAPDGLVDVFVLLDCFSHDVMTRFLYGVRHGTDAISNPQDRPLVVNLKRAQIWTPLWVNFSWFHGSWLAKLLLGEDYRQTLGSNSDVRKAIEQRLREHDNDPKKDEEFSLYRTMRLSKVDGDHMTRNYMASEMYDHLKAGQQTTASTLTYICWRLSRHQDWQSRLRKELKGLESTAAGEMLLSDIVVCPVLDAVIRETMRLHPAASGRQERIVPAGGRTFSGVYVRGSTTVIGPTLVLHHNSTVFPNPLDWRPERWLEADEAKVKEMEFSFVPFGHGARICIGQHLAMMEIRLLVSSIYRRFSTMLAQSCTDDSMKQLGTLAAVPRGLKCELIVGEK